jgi:ribosome-associated toxin RatA of RatAB toxin-antitoxin module
MPTVRRSVIVPRSCAAMFDLVDDFERYPEFLPWCKAGELLERGERDEVARLTVDYRGLRTQLTTRNLKERPRSLRLELVDGPFEHFAGAWRFDALGSDGCKVELALDYALSSQALQGLVGPVFGYIAETLVESFVQRAERMDGAT